MVIRTVVVGPLMTNCYIVANKAGGDALVIDPGGDAADIMASVRGERLNIKYIVNTHSHFDHTDANDELKEATGAEVCADVSDQGSGLPDPVKGWAPIVVDRSLKDGDEISVGDLKIKVISTPGHSPGSISLLVDKVLFSGDLVFQGSVGRTDFPGGSVERLKESLEWLIKLSDDTMVYPGHGDSFTIGEEKKKNPFLVWAGGDDDQSD